MKKIIPIIVSIAMFFVGFSTHVYLSKQESTVTHEQKNEAKEVTNNSIAETLDPLEIKVTLQKQFLDGNLEEETYYETIHAMEDFWASYEDWQVIDQKEGEMTFRKQIDDISPYLKQSGYFGLQNNMLSIFEGEPFHEQVIQSFYQIDTDTLESMQYKQLKNGIKIKSKDTYIQVLEGYRDLAPVKQVQG